MNSHTILLVDDEESLLEVLSFDLKRKGFEVICASNGVEALNIIKKGQKVDVILSDVRMPGGDGIQLVRQIRKQDLGDFPIILLSGFSELSDEEISSLGIQEILAKPFDRKALMDAVQRAIQKTHSQVG